MRTDRAITARVKCVAAIFLLTVACGEANRPSHADSEQETDATESRNEPAVSEFQRDYEVSSGAERWEIAEVAMPETTVAALDGNPDAARMLAEHYEFARNDAVTTNKWLKIAAENGDASSQEVLGQFLFNKGGTWNCRRGVFWVRRAVGNSDEQHVVTRSKLLESMSKDLSSCESRGKGGE